MPLELDGREVLRILIDSPEAFPESHAELGRVAQTLVVKQLRQRSLGIEGLRGVLSALGHDNFLLVADAMSEQEVRSLAQRMDPHHASLRGADASWVRGHLLQLAEGDLEPEKKTEGKSRAAREPAVRRTMSSRAMAAIAKPRDEPPPKAEPKDKEKTKAKAKAKGKKGGKKKDKG